MPCRQRHISPFFALTTSSHPIPLYQWRFWPLQWAGWGLIAIFSFPLKLYFLGTWQTTLMATLVRETAGFLLTVGLRSIYLRARPQPPARRIATLIIALSLVAASIDYLITVSFGYRIGSPLMDDGAFQLGTFCYRMFIFCFWSLLYFGIKGMQENERQTMALRDTELRMLRAQINPHFLFNALNTIQAGIGKDPQALSSLVQDLAGYLRYSLKFRTCLFVPLMEEYEAVAAYIAVEKARFRNGVEIESFLDPAARNLAVPGVLLQPLLENAVKHGHRTSPRPLRIRLRVTRPQLEWIEIEVANTGRWIPPEADRDPAGGVGLDNLRQRLHLLYPEHTHTTLTTCAHDGWVVVSLRIPVTS